MPTHCATNKISLLRRVHLKCTHPDRLTDRKTNSLQLSEWNNVCIEIVYKIIIFINKLFKKQHKFMSAIFYLHNCSFFFIAYNYCVLKPCFLWCIIKSTSKKGHKNSLYCYLHIYNESTKRVVHLCLDPRGHTNKAW